MVPKINLARVSSALTLLAAMLSATVPATLHAHASHYVFESNQADVLGEMDAFIAGLK